MYHNKDEYILVFGGDVMLGRSFNNLFRINPEFDPWGNIRLITDNADFFAFNLETTITDYNKKWPNKVFNFKLEKRYIDKLTSSGVNYVSTANNHIMDFQVEGMIDTLTTLDQNGILHAGSGGINATEYVTFALNNDLNIKLWSLSDHYDYWSEYIWYVDIYNRRWDHIIEKIKSDIDWNDFPVVSLHWGPNYINNISLQMRDFARELANVGVRVIHGHSAHHVLPIEYIESNFGGCIVFYSLGDLVDDYAIDEKYRNDLGCLASIIIDSVGNFKDISIFPTIIKDMQVNIITNINDEDYKRVLNILYNR